MPQGGTGSKRSEINLEKHLMKKKSVVRIQNSDDLCLARALVIAKANINNDSRDCQIREHHRPLYTRLAEELHQKAGMALGPCSLDKVKQFQTYLDAIIYAGTDKEKEFICTCTITITMLLPRCPGFSHKKSIAIVAGNHMTARKVVSCCECNRFFKSHVSIGMSSRPEMHNPFAKASSNVPVAIKCSGGLEENPKDTIAD